MIVSLTNIGDVVLTCPVIDILKRDFPQAKIDVMVGPKAVTLFMDNPNFGIKVFDKQALFSQKCAWFFDLCREGYDCVIDLRHTMLSFFLRPGYSTQLISGRLFKGHKREIHLNRLRQVYEFDLVSKDRFAIQTTQEDEQFFETQVSPFLEGRKFVVIAPGAADSAKRWSPKGFAALADFLSQNYKIVFTGDSSDVMIVEEIKSMMKSSSISLAGKINLRALSIILKKASLAIVHDSGVMHLASYFNVPLVALWGPTSVEQYGPWSEKSVVVRSNEKCVRCQEPKSVLAHNCMSFISIQDVLEAVKNIDPTDI